MGTHEVELERTGEKIAVNGSDPVCSFIHNIIIHIIRPKSSGRVTHDSHKLQIKAINHSTRHYMNRISRFTYRCCVYSAFLPRMASVQCRHSQAARATPSNHTQRYASCYCSELAALLLKYTETICIASIQYGLFGRAHCVHGVMQLWPYELERLS